MEKSILSNLLTANFCHPVKSGTEYYSTACIMYDESSDSNKTGSSVVLGKSLYIPIVKLTEEKIKNGVAPNDRLCADDVEKYIGNVPADLKIKHIVISGESFLDSISFENFTDENGLSNKPIAMFNPVHDCPLSKDNTLKNSLVVKIKIKEAPSDDDILHMIVVIENSQGEKSSIYINCNVTSLSESQETKKIPLTESFKDNKNRYKKSVEWLDDYYNDIYNFKILPKVDINIEIHGKQKKFDSLIWQKFFSKKLDSVKRHLASYRKHQDLVDKSSITIDEYIHRIPDEGLNFDKTFNTLYSDIQKNIDMIKSSGDEQYKNAAIAELNQIHDFLNKLISDSKLNLNKIKKLKDSTSNDHFFFDNFEKFLEQYCNALVLINQFIYGDKEKFVANLVPFFNNVISYMGKNYLLNTNICDFLLSYGNNIVAIPYDLVNLDKDGFKEDFSKVANSLINHIIKDPALIALLELGMGTISEIVYQKIQESEFIEFFTKLITSLYYLEFDIEGCLEAYRYTEYDSRMAQSGLITFDDIWTKTIDMMKIVFSDTEDLIKKLNSNELNTIENSMKKLQDDWSTLTKTYFEFIKIN